MPGIGGDGRGAWGRGLLVGLLLLLGLGARPAHAGQPHPLALLPREKLLGLAPLLRSTDLVLLESDAKGGMNQITIMSLVAAPPRVMHDVITQPERYGEFVRNMTQSSVKKLPDGSLEHTYLFDYGIFDAMGVHRIVMHAGDPGPVELFDAASYGDGIRHFRWEFLPAAGGTLVVQYGYIELSRSGGLVEQLRSRLPTLDFGMGMVGQLTQVLAMKGRAEQLAGAPPPLPAPGGADYSFLLDRGVVALLRSQGGRLSELTLIDRSTAPPEALLRAAQNVEGWPSYVQSIKSSAAVGTRDQMQIFDLVQALPLLTFATRFGVRSTATSVDLAGLSGDLVGARMRFDVRRDAQGRSQIVYRSAHNFERASFALRQLYRLEPLFDHGINVGLALLIQRGVRGYAERTAAAR